jgi:hypothetical protein
MAATRMELRLLKNAMVVFMWAISNSHLLNNTIKRDFLKNKIKRDFLKNAMICMWAISNSHLSIMKNKIKRDFGNMQWWTISNSHLSVMKNKIQRDFLKNAMVVFMWAISNSSFDK